MKVFISWSGTSSELVAAALRDWLPMVIQSLRPFMSQADIPSGQRWEEEIGSQLATTTFGVVCLTPDNLTAPWLLFEAGALSKAIPDSLVRVVPLCHGIKKTDVKPPLGLFQARVTERDDLLRLVKDINAALPEPLSDAILLAAFEAHWPSLEKKLSAVPAVGGPRKASAASSSRSAEDMLSEVLAAIRDLSRATSRTLPVQGRSPKFTFEQRIIDAVGDGPVVMNWPNPRTMQLTLSTVLTPEVEKRLLEVVAGGRYDLVVSDETGISYTYSRDDPPF